MSYQLDRFNQIIRDRLAAGKIEVPVLPQVASQVLQLTTDVQADASKLSELIHKDQSLAGHILQIANSVAYCGRVSIVSLQQAIARLGMNLIGEIAFAACVRNRVFNLPDHQDVMRDLWHQSIASGAYAKEIARLLRRNVEGAFLCGLLHNVGKPIVLQSIADVESDERVILSTENVISLIDTYHAEFGRLIAASWELPDVVRESIQHWSDYDQAPAFQQEAKITCLAGRLGTYVAVTDAYDEDTVRDHPVYEDLNFYQDDIDTLLELQESVCEIVESMTL